MLKVWTVVGTRPEIIRLSTTIKLFDRLFDHRLIHTGQNQGDEMSEVFFRDLDLRQPDDYFGVTGPSLGALFAEIFVQFENLLANDQPDALVVLGDTNSALVTILARRKNIPTYHLEAGTRSFDHRVPEEINRRIVDHTADFNVAYNTYSFDNLMREGLDPRRTFISGSPMLEVINSIRSKVELSKALTDHGLAEGKYLVGSFHRQENVDIRERLEGVIRLCNGLVEKYSMPMLVSIHPRTKNMMEKFGLSFGDGVRPEKPFGFVEYLRLQKSSFATISDSGTLAEESSILGFVGVSAREATERPEANNHGYITLSSSSLDNCVEAIELGKQRGELGLPDGYEEEHFSVRISNIISSTARRRNHILGAT